MEEGVPDPELNAEEEDQNIEFDTMEKDDVKSDLEAENDDVKSDVQDSEVEQDDVNIGDMPNTDLTVEKIDETSRDVESDVQVSEQQSNSDGEMDEESQASFKGNF